MTPMVDLFSLLLTFFILTATVRPQEPAPVDVPFSVSEKTVPDANIMTVLISSDDRIFFNVDNGPDTLLKYRPKILAEMGKRYNIEFTETELRKFEKFNSPFGVPIERMKEYLSSPNLAEAKELQTGIPIDSLNNQLSMWVFCSREVNKNVQACIKGDAKVEYPIVKQVLDIFQDRGVNRFNLITSLEAIQVTQEIQE